MDVRFINLLAIMFYSTVVKGRVFTDDTGLTFEIPVLLTSEGPIDILIDYLIEHWDSRSPSWMIKIVASIKLFIEYLHAAGEMREGTETFENFRRRLQTGTASATNKTDGTGLWWPARDPKVCQRIITNLTDFFNWWSKHNFSKANPVATWNAGSHEKRLMSAAYEYRRNKAFLGHTWSSVEETMDSHSAKRKGIAQPKVDRGEPPAFPEDRILDLIFHGFKVGNRYDFRNMLITTLMNGAGFRESEPFHLYLSDVIEDPSCKGSALVLIHHPAWGVAPLDPLWVDASGRRRKGNRAEYLAERFGLSPRDWGMSTAMAGWKGGMHESEHGGYYKQAYWFVPEFGKIFWEIWNIYVEQILSIPTELRFHPYAFMNIGRNPIGEMYKIGKFQRSHAVAVRRIGLEPSKYLGTSEHGHRHAFAQRLVKAGIPPHIIRRLIHHSDISSQEVYTKAGIEECLHHIKLGVDRLNNSLSTLSTSSIRSRFEEFPKYKI